MSLKRSVSIFLTGSVVVLGITACSCDSKEQSVDAPAMQSELERFSYSVGVLLAQDMSNKGMGDIDERAMGLAVRDVLDGNPLRLSEEQMGEALELAAQRTMERQLAKEKAAADKAKLEGDKFRAENAKREGVTTLSSGIQYKVLTEGKGEKPTLDSTVVAHYSGSLIDGSVFDSSYERGSPASFALSRVVEGWQEVLPMMTVGSKWQVVIPPELAYGEEGAPPRIGGNETLLFDIELIEIK